MAEGTPLKVRALRMGCLGCFRLEATFFYKTSGVSMTKRGNGAGRSELEECVPRAVRFVLCKFACAESQELQNLGDLDPVGWAILDHRSVSFRPLSL